MRPIGLIAGGGRFPLIFARRAVARGYRVVAAAYRGETEAALAAEVAVLEWFHLGQVGRLIRFFKTRGVDEAVMMGGVAKTRLFTDLRPDAKALGLLMRMPHTHDDGLLRAFAGALEAEGIRVRAATFLLPEMLAPAGCWTRRRPGRGELADLRLGLDIAREIGRLDIGQCVVVGGGTVLAVEAIDGTDATLRRGGALAKGQAVAVKVCKPTQDPRFDMPAVGVETVACMQASGIRALAVEAGRAVVFDRTAMIASANLHGIAILGWREEERD